MPLIPADPRGRVIGRLVASLRRGGTAPGEVTWHPGPRQGFVAAAPAVAAVCHPEWLGIRAATHASGLPVIEAADLGEAVGEILDGVTAAGTRLLLINGFPPGTRTLAEAARQRDVKVRVVMHSSMAQHGFEAAEAAIVGELCAMTASGLIDRLGFSKEGLAEAFVALGCDAVWVPPRIPSIEATAAADVGPGRHVGLFGAATWRKNVTTQLGAAAIMNATAHVSATPDVPYLERARLVDHGQVSRPRILGLIAAMDVNFAVSLYECFPILPQESYQLGVPCLVSRTSSLFRSDPTLWELSTVAEHDNPSAIATAAELLLRVADAEGVVDRARAWMEAWNRDTADERAAFADAT